MRILWNNTASAHVNKVSCCENLWVWRRMIRDDLRLVGMWGSIGGRGRRGRGSKRHTSVCCCCCYCCCGGGGGVCGCGCG
jgi:hypothetical protein